MGIYLVGVGAQEWFDEDEEEGGLGAVSAGLNEELRRRGLPPYESVPEASAFEEKLVPPMDGFSALCRAHLSREAEERLLGWTVLVPISLDEEIRLPVESSYTDETTLAGAPQVLALAEQLATVIGLPPEIPATNGNLELTSWFLDGPAREMTAARPGPWAKDLDTAFYTALYLSAARHSLRRGCPMKYS
ncbi:hypothetical protein OG800_05170 [Streptomyces sp. NBC_00445]|uniref:hypothetical protein n=1 Tax=unclassified Streptomyces TaxID=2593676 RepID=UPI002E200CA1|nr:MULTISPECIES: hypothetical protein [unclassified Streptomyces]